MKLSLRLSYLYSGASAIIGPAIVFLTSGAHSSGWDCYDSSWDTDGGPYIPIADREAIYDHAARFMTPIASIMIITGIIILSYLIYSSIKNKRPLRAIAPACLILFMIVGYSLIIALASSDWC